MAPSQAELLLILDQVDTGFALFDFQQQLVRFNPALLEVWHLNPEWLHTHPRLDHIFVALVAENLWQKSACLACRKALESVVTKRVETIILTELCLEMRVIAMADGGFALVFRHLPRDTTPARAIADDSEALYRTLVENFPYGVMARFEHNLRMSLVDGTILSELGLSKEMIEGKTPREVFPAEVCDLSEPYYRAALTGTCTTFEQVFNDRTFEITTLPIRNDRGVILAGMLVARDITALKQAKSQLDEANALLHRQITERTSELTEAIAQWQREAVRRQQAQRTLLDSEQRYRSVVNALPEGIILQDANGIIQTCNASAASILRMPASQLLGQPGLNLPWETIYEDGSPFPPDRYPALVSLRTGAPCYSVVMGIHHPLGLTWLAFNTQPLCREEESQPYAVVTSFTDITERKHTQTQLQTALQRVNLHFENMLLGVIETDADFRILRWSRAAEAIFGWQAKDVLGKVVGDDLSLVFADDVAAVRSRLMEMVQGKKRHSVSRNYNYRQDGTIIYCEWYDSALVDSVGRVVSVLSLVHDITEQTLAMEALERQERRSHLFAAITLKIRQSLQIETILQTTVDEVRTLLMADRVLLYRLAPGGSATVCTEAIAPNCLSLLDRASPSEVIPALSLDQYRAGRICRIDDVESADMSQCNLEFLRQHSIRAKLIVPLLKGDDLWGLLIAHACHAPRQWSEFEVSLVQQLADQFSLALTQSQLVQALQESETRFRQLTDSIPEAFWLSNPCQTEIAYISTAYEKIWGYPCDSLYADGTAWLVTVHPDDCDRVVDTIIQHSSTKAPYEQEYRIRRADGEWRWVRDRAVPILDENGTVYRLAGISEDITDRKQQEERLRLLESAILNANDSILITEATPLDAPGPRVVFVNDAFTRATGYSAEEILGQSPRLLQGPKSDRAILQAIRAALETWQPIAVELLNYRKDGSEFWVDLSIVPVADHTGHYTHWLAIQRDISHRKAIEAELIKSLEKEKELGELKSRFVTMTSHEFRTPLSVIFSASELLEHYSQKWTETERLEQLHLIQATVEHMTALLEDVLLIGRADAKQLTFQPNPLDITQFCHDLVTQIQASIGKRHRVEFVSRCALTAVWVDEKLLKQILTNLLSNATKYSPDGSTIHFELDHKANALIFQIRDAGIGIPSEDLPHLFDSFHRAKNVGMIPGTGLGLAIVKNCVDAHGGTLAVDSKVGVGTTFVVTLPAVCENEGEEN